MSETLPEIPAFDIILTSYKKFDDESFRKDIRKRFGDIDLRPNRFMKNDRVFLIKGDGRLVGVIYLDNADD